MNTGFTELSYKQFLIINITITNPVYVQMLSKQAYIRIDISLFSILRNNVIDWYFIE